MSRLGPIDWVIALVYLATTLGLGVWFTGKQADNEEYFLGGRQVNWLAMSLSIFATAFSSISFLAYPREVAYENFQFFVAILCIPLIISPLLAWVFVPFFMNLRCVSAYEYLERRFHPGLRRFGSLLFMAYAIGWMGTMLYAVGLILKTLLSLSDTGAVLAVIGVGLFVTLYTTLGGIKAVIWTDVIQSAVIVGSISLITLCALREIDGGLATVVRLGHEHGKFEMLNFDLDWSQRGTFYAACAFGLFMYLPGYTVSQAQVQRYITVKNLADARRALLLNALLLPAVILVFFFLGTVLFAYYHNRGGLPDLPAGKQDQIMPLFVMTVLPGTGLVGLLVAAIMASAMSTFGQRDQQSHRRDRLRLAGRQEPERFRQPPAVPGFRYLHHRCGTPRPAAGTQRDRHDYDHRQHLPRPAAGPVPVGNVRAASDYRRRRAGPAVRDRLPDPGRDRHESAALVVRRLHALSHRDRRLAQQPRFRSEK